MKRFIFALLAVFMLFPLSVSAKTYSYDRTYCVGLETLPSDEKLKPEKAVWEMRDDGLIERLSNGNFLMLRKGKTTLIAKYEGDTYIFNINISTYWKPIGYTINYGNFSFTLSKASKNRIFIKIKNKNNKSANVNMRYIQIGKKTYYMNYDNYLIIAPKSSRTIKFQSGEDFDGKVNLKEPYDFGINCDYYLNE